MRDILAAAVARREAWLADRRSNAHPKRAFRLFDGFREGNPRFVLDVYGTSLVVFDHASEEAAPGEDDPVVRELVEAVREELPFLRSAVHKKKASQNPLARRGAVVLGTEKELCRSIEEDGVRYAVRLMMHHDASFYLDTRKLRAFVRQKVAGQRVLNAFAYTGSVGVAARAAPAREVVQTDKSGQFLNVAKDSYSLNGFHVDRASFIAVDFFEAAARLRKSSALFDCVILDPPLFSDSPRGRVDVEASFGRLADKTRPLVGDGGLLIVVNNGLFVSGAEFLASLEVITGQGYATFEGAIGVPEDCAPAPPPPPAADPAPFNHSTKIAVLRMKRRDGKKAT